MILRKPYAFLIKHFKIINIILTLLSGYLLVKYYQVISFFNQYAVNSYSGLYYQGFYKEYLNIYMYLAIILIIIGVGGILLLFINKKKPAKDYFISLVYYIIFFIIIFVIRNFMISLETQIITTETARLYRDITIISIIPQLLFIVMFFLRGIGLYSNKFNFQQDIKELEISSEDNEEFELTFKKDGVKLKRVIRRFFREFIYYVRENKFIFIIICIILSIAGFFVIKNNLPKDVNKRFRQGKDFYSLGLKYNIQDSIVTNLTYNGNKIKKDTYYIVAKLYIENDNDIEYRIDYNRFRLEIDDKYYYPRNNNGVYFIDYARPSIGNTISKHSSGLYSLIYEIDKDQIKKNYRIKVDGGVKSNNRELIGSYNYISITPVLIENVSIENNYTLGDEINFGGSNLKNTKLKVNNPEITDAYTYNYQFCTKYNNCDDYIGQVKRNVLKNDTTLIVLDYEYNIDNNSPFYNLNTDVHDFMNTYVKVRYLLNQRDEFATVEDVTPSNLEGKVVLETSNKIKSADEIVLIITIRNKEYTIKLK